MQYVVKVEDEATKNHKQNEHDIVTCYTGCPKKNLRCLNLCKVKTIKAVTLK